MNDDAPADLFDLLGHETRVDILQALDACRRGSGSYPVEFSALYDATGAEVTSTFSYHLTQLEGVYVDGTDDGYRLTSAGDWIVRLLYAGITNDATDVDKGSVETVCPACGLVELVTEGRDEYLGLVCPSCDRRRYDVPLSPGTVDGRTTDEIVTAVGRTIRHEFRSALDDICPTCGGRLDESIDVPFDDPRDRFYRAECTACRRVVKLAAWYRLFEHPAVIGFYWDHGVDLLGRTVWELGVLADDWERAIVGDGPIIEVRIDESSERLRLETDGKYGLLSAERTRVVDGAGRPD